MDTDPILLASDVYAGATAFNANIGAWKAARVANIDSELLGCTPLARLYYIPAGQTRRSQWQALTAGTVLKVVVPGQVRQTPARRPCGHSAARLRCSH